MHISSCLEDLQLKVRDIKIKENEEDEMEISDEKSLCIELEVYNRRGVKSIIVADAVKKLEGILSVNVT